MQYITDLHIHSKYAMACSEQLTLENMDITAHEKGIKILGTGDFTHPKWIKEIKSKLTEHNGIFRLGGPAYGTNFILSSEVCTIYEDRTKKSRKIHNCIFAPNIEVAEQINAELAKHGDLMSDGRPALMMSPAQLVETVNGISADAFVFPAHCVLPNQPLIMNPDIKEIKDAKVGDKVFTHTGEAHKIEKVLSREYEGTAFNIIPWYFSAGTEVTAEHPFLAIKSVKNCGYSKGACRPTEAHIRNCYRRYYKKYKPEWIIAENLEVGDILLYPRFSKDNDINSINLSDYELTIGNLPKEILLDSDFCKLIGYYLAEGYTNSRDGIGFSFNKDKELKYVEEVKTLVTKIFGISTHQGKTEGDIIIYSKDLMKLFQMLFYSNSGKKAQSKCLPNWMLSISRAKQVEILRCWWRGDSGYTVSRLLHNQMKIICLRLGIIPSTRIDHRNDYMRRGKHFINGRKINANYDTYVINSLLFLEGTYGFLSDSEFKRCIRKTDNTHGWIDKEFIYMPIRKIAKRAYNGTVFNLEVEKDHSFLTEAAIIHNCWTPWFGALGAFSGSDSIEDAYEDQAKHIHALETGLSSDPQMNWRISKLDKYSLISGSDAHSLPKMGREAIVVEIDEKKLSYNELINRIKSKEMKLTVEFYPEEGKYHFDGHRNCNISLTPEQSSKYGDRCPKCGKRLTIGVLHRIDQLADREDGYTPKGAVPFVHAIPLQEVIAYVMKKNTYSPFVKSMYQKMIESFGTEFNVLLNSDVEKIKNVDKDLGRAIESVREGRVNLIPGYDGVFGIIDIFNEVKETKEKGKQAQISDF